jgi:phospholipid/cholesterol/gamma-HCH transport system ATP-binding protein
LSGDAPSETIISFRAVSKAFGEKIVLDNIDLDVIRGEVLVILGGSGSGKSVALRQMNGLDHPDSGTVLVDGVDVARLKEDELIPIRLKVGMLFQSGALFDSMTVFENLAFPLWEHTKMTDAEIRERAVEVLGLVDLEPAILPLLPSSLSGGMRKRVALARAISLKPAVLLYDEPTTGLDPVTAMTINRLVTDLNSRLATTSVVVTHDITTALFIADRIAFLKDGRFVFCGKKEDALSSDVPDLRAFFEAGETHP